MDICNEPEYADLPPNQIVPTLADTVFISHLSQYFIEC